MATLQIFSIIVLSIIVIISASISKSYEHFTDDMVFQNPNVEVKNSTIEGRGVFALRDFAPGELIELAPSLVDECNNFNGKLRDYITDTLIKEKCAINLGYFNYYNHSDDNNANYFVDAKTSSIKVIAEKAISKGDEIFVNYGEGYWSSRKETTPKL